MDASASEWIARSRESLARGDIDAAVVAAERAVTAAPADGEAHLALGTALAKRGDEGRAEIAFRESIRIGSTGPRAHANLSVLLKSQGRLELALESLARATEIDPSGARLFARRGQLERDLDLADKAVASFRRAFELEPTSIHRDAYGRALVEVGKLREATALLEAAEARTKDGLLVLAYAADGLGDREALRRHLAALIEASPGPALALSALDLVKHADVMELGVRLAEIVRASAKPDSELAERATLAIASCEEGRGNRDGALAVLEGHARAHPSEGIFAALLEACHRLEAKRRIGELIELCTGRYPESVRVQTALGMLYRELDKIDESAACLETAVSLDPEDAFAQGELALTYAAAGYHTRAREAFRRCFGANPLDAPRYSSFIFPLVHDPATRPEEVLACTRRWSDRFGLPVRTVERRPLSPDPERRIKIGYLSSDLRDHPVARFVIGLLRHHDRERFEVHCFSKRGKGDRIEQEIRSLDLTFHTVESDDPDEVARRIADAGIDIAVDLSGFTAGSLVVSLTRCPAPIQVTYVGWPATTGIPEVDVRITDALADPIGRTDALHTERLVRLPVTSWCYDAMGHTPIVERDPGAPLVLGSFNRASKLSRPLLDAWADILGRLPHALLLIKGRALFSNLAQRRVREAFEARGIDPARLMMLGWAPSTQQHLAAWGDVDIALDSFPYAGTTTTCEALYMGVPVVTRTGEAHVQNVGASLLAAVGLGDLVASDFEGYADRVVALAADEPRRRMLRITLRDKLARSRLGDGPAFTRSFEEAMRSLFVEYVTGPRAQAPRGSRLTRLAPRHHVEPSIAERETFVAFEQGRELDAGADVAVEVLAARAARSGAALAYLELEEGLVARALELAARSEVKVVARPKDARSASLLAASAALHPGARVELFGDAALSPTALTLAEVEGEAWLDETRADLADLQAQALVRVVTRSHEQTMRVARAAQARGLSMLLAYPLLGGLVERDRPFDELERSVLVVTRPVLARLREEGVACERGPAAPAGRDAFEMFSRARDRGRPLGERAAALEAGYAMAADALAMSGGTAARLTAARFALETGRRSELEHLLTPVIERPEPVDDRCLPALPSYEGPATRDARWGRLQALEALVIFGARSSFDRRRRHPRLLLRFFREGGESSAMDRRLGLLLSLLEREGLGD